MSAQNSPSDEGAEADSDESTPLLWERQPGETLFAFQAFARYRDLPKRTLLAAYRQETGKKQAKAAPGLWTSWYSRFDWKTRADAYDAHRDRLTRETAEQAHLAEIEGYRSRQRKLATAATELSVLLLQKVNTRVKDLEPGEISVSLIPVYLRAALGAAQTATSAEAEALGIEDLLKQLDEQQGSDASEPD